MDSFFWVDCCPLEILHTISDDVLFQDLDSGHSISQAFLKILEAKQREAIWLTNCKRYEKRKNNTS